MSPYEKHVDHIKEEYPRGARIIVDKMGCDPHPIPAGTKGTVMHVDDIGTIHCCFENGRALGLIVGEDIFHKI